MSHVPASHVTPAEQELRPEQFTVQLVPPHVTKPLQALVPPQSMLHELAPVQSMPPEQPLRPQLT